MKYIVTYFIIKFVLVPCPPIEKTDEFGRSLNDNISLSVACFKPDTAKISKEFFNKQDAIDFIKRGEADSSNLIMERQDLKNFKLDSTIKN